MNTELIQALQDSSAELIAAAQSIPEALTKTKPAPDRWSALDCVEHIVITEGRFFGWLENPQPDPAPPENKDKEAMIAQRLSSRDQKAQAPEPARPTGRFATLDEALDEFRLRRTHTIQFALEKGAGLYAISTKHPLFGPVNGAELMCMMAAHSRRHAAQIREIKEELLLG